MAALGKHSQVIILTHNMYSNSDSFTRLDLDHIKCVGIMTLKMFMVRFITMRHETFISKYFDAQTCKQASKY